MIPTSISYVLFKLRFVHLIFKVKLPLTTWTKQKAKTVVNLLKLILNPVAQIKRCNRLNVDIDTALSGRF